MLHAAAHQACLIVTNYPDPHPHPWSWGTPAPQSPARGTGTGGPRQRGCPPARLHSTAVRRQGMVMHGNASSSACSPEHSAWRQIKLQHSATHASCPTAASASPDPRGRVPRRGSRSRSRSSSRCQAAAWLSSQWLHRTVCGQARQGRQLRACTLHSATGMQCGACAIRP